jgi:hypothetical protein
VRQLAALDLRLTAIDLGGIDTADPGTGVQRPDTSPTALPRSTRDEGSTLMTKPSRARGALAAMHAGLALTALATIATYADHSTTHLLSDHIRAGYPNYSQARVDSAVTTYLVVLSVIGALGILAWLTTGWAVKVGKRWARSAATVMLVIGIGVALTELLTKDTSGATGLPPTLGWAGMIPCLAGVVAVALLWGRPRLT